MNLDNLAEQIVGAVLKGWGGPVIVGIIFILVWKFTVKSFDVASSNRPPSFLNFFFALMTKVGPLLILFIGLLEVALIAALIK